MKRAGSDFDGRCYTNKLHLYLYIFRLLFENLGFKLCQILASQAK